MAAATIGSPEDNRCLRFLRRHPHLDLALLPALLGALLFIFSWTRHAPPEFSATITRFDGLDSSHRAEGPPSFGVTFRAHEPQHVAVLLQAEQRQGSGGGVHGSPARPRRPPGVLRAGEGRCEGACRRGGRGARDARRAVPAHGGSTAEAGARAADGAREAGGGPRAAAQPTELAASAALVRDDASAERAVSLPQYAYGELRIYIIDFFKKKSCASDLCGLPLLHPGENC
jgi:hypothetical protein